MKHLLVFLAILGLLLTFQSTAQVPNKISYQGLLTTSSGTPVQDGSYDLRFDIYDVLSGGSSLWAESHSAVSISKGTFNVILGSVSGLTLPFDNQYYVEVTALAGPGISSPITFSPRSVLTTSPYSFRADTANYAKESAKVWKLRGNAGTDELWDFIGTTDNKAFSIRTNYVLRTRITTKGQIETYNTGQSVFIGEGAGANDDLTDNNNVFIGYQSGNSNTTGGANTANGSFALYSNTTGNFNTANGAYALYSNTIGGGNTANGFNALFNNNIGEWNTANGGSALYNNTIGTANIAYGAGALYNNVAGSNATAIGSGAMLYANNTGAPFTNYNVAVGYEALRGSTTPANNTGNYNTAIGYQTLRSNTTGNLNTANGCMALYFNTTGNYNTANGIWSLYYITNQSDNTAVGYSAGDYYTFSQSTFLGRDAYPNTSGYTNCMGLGYNARPTGSNRVHIGNTAITWIGGQVNWSTYSDGRYKRNIREDVKGLDFIMRLRPVTYNVVASEIASFLKEDQKRDKDRNVIFETNEIDRKAREEKEKIRYTGFIAQEVEQAAKEAGFEFSGVDVPKDENGLYSLSYAEFVVPLVKAVQELKRENDELRKRVEELEKRR